MRHGLHAQRILSDSEVTDLKAKKYAQFSNPKVQHVFCHKPSPCTGTVLLSVTMPILLIAWAIVAGIVTGLGEMSIMLMVASLACAIGVAVAFYTCVSYLCKDKMRQPIL